MGVAVKPDDTAIYVTTGSFGSLFFIDPRTNEPIGSIAVGQRTWGIGLLPDGRTAYSANGPSNDVSVINVQTRQVVTKIQVGTVPEVSLSSIGRCDELNERQVSRTVTGVM